jgi:hypothetical protein
VKPGFTISTGKRRKKKKITEEEKMVIQRPLR